MTGHRITFALAAGALALAVAAPRPAAAMKGADTGDSYINDLQHNPRLIEPYQGGDPRRYRIGNPQAGFDDRQLAREGYYSPGSGYVPPRPRGRVEVYPYGIR